MHDAEQHPDQKGSMADRVMSVDAAFQGMHVTPSPLSLWCRRAGCRAAWPTEHHV
jgi:hypothetical protein